MSFKTSVPLWRNRALLSGVLASAFGAPAAFAQSPVPIRELSPVDAKTTTYFGNIFGIRQLNGGKVLVNDGIKRQLVVLDDKLSNPTVIVDSVSEGGQSYGRVAAPLIPYLADSSLFVDGTSLSLLVIDPTGKISHVMSAPKPGDLRNLASSSSGVDAKGNLLYRGNLMVNATRNPLAAAPAGAPPAIVIPDSAPLLRANFDTRMVDTVGRIKIQSGNRPNISMDASGKMQIKLTINPINTIDDWAVLSDGTIELVRGHDYHVDVISPDGKAFSAAKLPFDWKRLTDADKQALIDSAQAVQDKAVADAKAAAATPAAAAAAGQQAAMTAAMAAMGGGGGGGGGGGAGPEMRIEVRGAPGGGGGGGSFSSAPDAGRAGGPGGFGGMPPMTIEYVPLKDIADYYPAIRPGALKADLDGNLWVFTTTSAQSKAGEIVYDIINNRGELTQRVRMPVGRSVAGFGHNGIVYLMFKDGTKGWALERTKVVGYTRATD